MNRRNKEFAEEVRDLLCRVRDNALNKAEENHCSPYDIELDAEEIIKEHMTFRMIATRDCAQRHLENLIARRVLVYSNGIKNGKHPLKLNAEFADQNIDLLIAQVHLPANETAN